jgi:glutamate racemase
MASVNAPIGVFDSGVGGLSILRPLRAQLPAEPIVFFADQAHVPYGPRPLDEVQRFSVGITRFLIDQGAKLIIVACNTASAAALQHLRGVFPGMAFVGMEPAVKPAAEQTRTRRVGVLATPATFQGALFASVVERFAQGVRVIPQTLPGLVERIEAGDLDGPETRRIVEAAVRPLVAQGVDTLVLACTHYPFVIPWVEEVAGPGVQVIDPSPAIARQAARLLAEGGKLAPAGEAGVTTLVTSGNPARLAAMALRLIGESGEARRAAWDEAGEGLALSGDSV